MHVDERVGNRDRCIVTGRQSKEKHEGDEGDREVTDTHTQRGQFK